LSEPEFREAVRQALQDFTRPDALTANPLLRSRMVAERLGPDTSTSLSAGPKPADRLDAFRLILSDSALALQANPRDEKLFRALDRTYFHPAPTQEAAAELLDLPFSTYRRHLTAGIQRLTEILWQKELSGGK
jgi:hypothetical protein